MVRVRVRVGLGLGLGLGYKEETNVAHCLVRIYVSLSDLFPYTEYTYG